MQTGSIFYYRIFAFMIFIFILIFIAGSLNLSAKRDFPAFKPYKPDVVSVSVPSPSEISSSDAPDTGIDMPYIETEPAETEPAETEPAETEPAETEPAETEPAETEPAETEPAETEPAKTEPTGTGDFQYKFDNQLPASDPVDNTYFSNALFIGDSRTVGFCNFSAITKYCYARVSLNIRSVLTKEFIEDTSGGETITRTVLDTVKVYPKAFDKIYISFGTNEYSWPGTTFIACYEYFINALRDILPDVPIYVQSVLPVDEIAAERNGYRLKNDQLHAFNTLLAEMTERLGVCFVNTAEAVTAENSFSLPPGLAGDGVHLNKSTCDKIKDYLFSHTVSGPNTDTAQNN